jgi:hypothetical protein
VEGFRPQIVLTMSSTVRFLPFSFSPSLMIDLVALQGGMWMKAGGAGVDV